MRSPNLWADRVRADPTRRSTPSAPQSTACWSSCQPCRKSAGHSLRHRERASSAASSLRALDLRSGLGGHGCGLRRGVVATPHALDQHCPALAATDADGRHPALSTGALEHVEQVQDDARARCADRMTEGNRASVDVEPGAIERPERVVETELLAAVVVALPCPQAGDYLRGKRLVDLPGIEITERESVTLHDRCGRVHGTKSHLRRIKTRPLRIDDAALGDQIELLYRSLGCEQQPSGAIRDLRAVAGGDVAVLL